jgi:hypothetical protein
VAAVIDCPQIHAAITRFNYSGGILKKLIAVTFFAIVTAGCATFGQLENGLNALVGRSDSEVFNVLGYPNGKQEFGADTVYVWGNSRNTTMFLPQTQTTTGYVGTTPVYGTTTTTQAIPMNFNCTIKVIVSSGLVKTWEYDGNLGGCEPYINRLNRHFKK